MPASTYGVPSRFSPGSDRGGGHPAGPTPSTRDGVSRPVVSSIEDTSRPRIPLAPRNPAVDERAAERILRQPTIGAVCLPYGRGALFARVHRRLYDSHTCSKPRGRCVSFSIIRYGGVILMRNQACLAWLEDRPQEAASLPALQDRGARRDAGPTRQQVAAAVGVRRKAYGGSLGSLLHRPVATTSP